MKGNSNCCDAAVVNGICQDCLDHCGINKFDCDICEDTGKVGCMEAVYPGEPHMADIGEQMCECRL